MVASDLSLSDGLWWRTWGRSSWGEVRTDRCIWGYGAGGVRYFYDSKLDRSVCTITKKKAVMFPQCVIRSTLSVCVQRQSEWSDLQSRPGASSQHRCWPLLLGNEVQWASAQTGQTTAGILGKTPQEQGTGVQFVQSTAEINFNPQLNCNNNTF